MVSLKCDMWLAHLIQVGVWCQEPPDGAPGPGEHHSSYSVSNPDSHSSPDCPLSLPYCLPPVPFASDCRSYRINGRHSQKKHLFSLGEIAFMEFSGRNLKLSPSSLRTTSHGEHCGRGTRLAPVGHSFLRSQPEPGDLISWGSGCPRQFTQPRAAGQEETSSLEVGEETLCSGAGSLWYREEQDRLSPLSLGHQETLPGDRLHQELHTTILPKSSSLHSQVHHTVLVGESQAQERGLLCLWGLCRGAASCQFPAVNAEAAGSEQQVGPVQGAAEEEPGREALRPSDQRKPSYLRNGDILHPGQRGQKAAGINHLDLSKATNEVLLLPAAWRP